MQNEVAVVATPLVRAPVIRSKFLIPFLLFLCACGQNANRGALRPGIITTGAEIEIVSPQEQSLEEILQTSTGFVVPYGETKYAWERVLQFFKLYLDCSPSLETPLKGVTLVSNKSTQSSNFVFTVGKTSVSTGERYVVKVAPSATCQTSDAPKRADINAKNLARFIKDGQFDRSLFWP